MGYVLRLSLPSIGGLIGLLLGVGAAAVVLADLPLWFPAAFTVAFLGVQYVVNPAFIQWLVPASVVANHCSGYLTDDPVGQLVHPRRSVLERPAAPRIVAWRSRRSSPRRS